MNPGYLDNLEKGGSHLLYADWQRDNVAIAGVRFERCRFTSVGLRGAKFTNVAFFACRFDDLYMPYGGFDRVDLTACRFSDCNLRHTTFEDCKLWYTEFYRCEIDYESILSDLPTERNLRTRLLHNLRMNAESTGDTRTSDRIYIMEMDALTEENWCMFALCNEYYKKRYFGAARFSGLLGWAGLKLGKHIWGYGVRLSSLFRSAAVVILLSTLVLWLSEAEFVRTAEIQTIERLDFGDALYVSSMTFTSLGYGESEPQGLLPRVIVNVTAFCGAVFIGLLAAAAFRRIKR